ncbi:Transposase InsH, N-terminal [Syntrophomonas zehnderi OL-4]|uniref:Transposase InsH, N-terminal n=9 Tax=Syntrophomonas TaxID=862 RepID=A0A0E4GF79_9FIRM|nr:IS1182 family transposase [Syntrophomonas zehnderi]CFY04398.1 Transposase InsH, N-terminal [Syntrophomonas zehnderi OL-4]
MLVKNVFRQNSFYTALYQMIPDNHILKQIDSAIDLSFVNDLLADRYCKNFGRPAKEPEMMLRIQILKYLYNLSDEQLIQDLSVNLAYKWFVGLNPEDPLPETSLLTKFRTQRLKDISMDAIITEIVGQCVERGLIKSSNGIVIDTTHIEANTIKKVPERIMKHLARNIFKAMGQEQYEIPDYTQIEDHIEAKQVMKDYLEGLIEQVQEETSEEVIIATKEAQEVLGSDLFIEQKGIRSLVDKDARVGHKSKTQNFYGYKAEICQTTDGSLITSIFVEPGSYVDGSHFKSHLEESQKTGLNLTGIYGDKAYFRADILNLIKEIQAAAYIPVSASAYKIDEELYSYNKDSDQWFCVMGNETVKVKSKTRERNGKTVKLLNYSFGSEICRNCPRRIECIGKSKRIGKLLTISVNTPELYEYSQRAKTPEFIQEFRKRAKIEPKNAELKRFHGLDRAKGYGLRSIRIQAKLTALAVNLKRIAKLVSASKGLSSFILRFLFCRLQINLPDGLWVAARAA